MVHYGSAQIIREFTTGDLVAGKLVVSRANMRLYPSRITVYDQDNRQINEVDDLQIFSDRIELDFTSFTITGTWKVVIS